MHNTLTHRSKTYILYPAVFVLYPAVLVAFIRFITNHRCVCLLLFLQWYFWDVLLGAGWCVLRRGWLRVSCVHRRSVQLVTACGRGDNLCQCNVCGRRACTEAIASGRFFVYGIQCQHRSVHTIAKSSSNVAYFVRQLNYHFVVSSYAHFKQFRLNLLFLHEDQFHLSVATFTYHGADYRYCTDIDSVTASCAKRTGAAASVKRRRCEPAGSIPPE